MNDNQTTRRRFLLAATTFSGVAIGTVGSNWLTMAAAWADTPAESPDVFGRLAQQLFPHDGLDVAIYGQIMGDVIDAAAADPAMAALLDAAETELDSARSGRWIDLDADAQIEVLQELEGAAFFAPLRESVRFRLYYHPALWKHIDYPGSSKEHGGYKYRGFDDIAWLPEDA